MSSKYIMNYIYIRLIDCLFVWGTVISKVESNNIKVLQNACIRILTNGRLRQLISFMYKAINSIRFVEVVKQSFM